MHDERILEIEVRFRLGELFVFWLIGSVLTMGEGQFGWEDY